MPQPEDKPSPKRRRKKPSDVRRKQRRQAERAAMHASSKPQPAPYARATQRQPMQRKTIWQHPWWQRSAIGRFLQRSGQWYKKLFLRLPWLLRIVLLVVTAVVAYYAALVALNLLVEALCLIVVAMVIGGAVKSGGSGGSRESSWARDEQEYYQAMSDADQREHEDHGQV